MAEPIPDDELKAMRATERLNERIRKLEAALQYYAGCEPPLGFRAREALAADAETKGG